MSFPEKKSSDTQSTSSTLKTAVNSVADGAITAFAGSALLYRFTGRMHDPRVFLPGLFALGATASVGYHLAKGRHQDVQHAPDFENVEKRQGPKAK